jgi:hypothetical protein
MTLERDPERLLRQWFDDGPTQASDRVIDGLTVRIAGQHQRPAWRLDWRRQLMNHPTLKIAASAAAVVLIALIGLQLLPTGGASPGGVASPSPTAAASEAAAVDEPSHTPDAPGDCEDDAPGCAGVLEAGTNTSTNFALPVTFDVPAGWENSADQKGVYVLFPYAAEGGMIRMWSDTRIPTETSCAPTSRPEAPRAADWVDYINANEALTVIDSTPVTMGDGEGWMLDLEVAPDWTGRCEGLPGPNLTQFIIGLFEDGTPGLYGVASSDRMRLYVIDVGERTVLAWAYGRKLANLYEETFQANEPIFDSMQFSTEP